MDVKKSTAECICWQVSECVRGEGEMREVERKKSANNVHICHKCLKSMLAKKNANKLHLTQWNPAHTTLSPFFRCPRNLYLGKEICPPSLLSRLPTHVVVKVHNREKQRAVWISHGQSQMLWSWEKTIISSDVLPPLQNNPIFQNLPFCLGKGNRKKNRYRVVTVIFRWASIS